MPKKPILLVVTSDHHTNSTIGLCPAEGVKLNEGGRYLPSPAQKWLWHNWLDFWSRADAKRHAAKAELWLLYNGDLFDGDHHQTSQIITRHAESQQYIAEQVFGIPKALKPAKTFVVRGTEAHAGDAASMEEAFGKWLRAEREPETDAWSRWHLRLDLHGTLIDAQHHGRFGSRPWSGPNAVTSLAAEILMEHSIAGYLAPKLAFRSHRHRYGDSGSAFPVRVIQTPAWQLKTAYAHKVAPESIADLGGILCLIQPNGALDIEAVRYRPSLPLVVTA